MLLERWATKTPLVLNRLKKLFLLLACAAVAISLLVWRPVRRPAPPSQRGSPAAEFLALERAALQQDETTWATELQALRLGEKIVRLWDQLRSVTNRWEVCKQVRFDELRLPKLGPERLVERDIAAREFNGEVQAIRGTEWAGFLDQFSEWVLEQSDWRQIAFSTNSGPLSRFAVELHATHLSTGARYQVVFELDVQWAGTELGTLTVRQGRVLSQSGPPRFSPWFSMELPLVPGLETLDPFLAVYDLNGDDRPEIALLVQNTILRPKGARFAPETLCAFAPNQPRAGLFARFDADDSVDYLCAVGRGLLLFHGTPEGTFPTAPSPAWRAPEELPNPFVMTCGDIDGDGDLDVFLAQYKLPYVAGQMPTPFYDANDGFPAFLLLNDGNGQFTEATAAAGLAAKRHRRTYSASFVDLDRDGDLDLLVVSDFAGIDIYLNDGKGHFSDVTDSRVLERHAFGMAHALADFDRDGSLDILMIGMNSDAASRLDSMGLNRAGYPQYAEMRRAMTQGNRLYSFAEGVWRDRALELNIARAGWAWGVTAFDADGDGDTDVYIVNGHNSRETAMDYESQFWRHDIYTGNSELNPVAEMFFQSLASKLYGAGWSYGGYHKNKLFLNENGTNFIEAAYLLGVALEEDCRNLVSADLDNDGDREIVLITFQQWPRMRQTLHAFRNNGSEKAADNPRAAYVTGDSYRSQHPRLGSRFLLSQ